MQAQRVGIKYKDFNDPNTGEIYLDKNEQKEMEKVVRTFSNKTGGSEYVPIHRFFGCVMTVLPYGIPQVQVFPHRLLHLLEDGV